jgi:serine/threonine protein kinase
MEVGDRFGGYRLDAQLGRGGMGVVYEAYDTVRERRVALKVLVPHLADDETFRARFLREARTVAGLSSPHTVPVHDFGVLDGHLFLDMALVDGSDLAAVLARGPLSPVRAVSITEQVADALDTAHERGLVHRDVKPANVLLARRRPDQADFAYLSDFGLARSTSGNDGLTATGTVVGTADYMSPEQIEGRPVDARSDVYALGCLLFHCLAGRPPYTGSNQVLVLDAHRTAAPPVLPAGGTWGDLDAVVARALAKDPADRFASAGELASAARSALAAAAASGAAPTVVGLRTGPTSTVGGAAAASAPASAQIPPPPPVPVPGPVAAPQPDPLVSPQPAWQPEPSAAPLDHLQHQMAHASPTGTVGAPRRQGLSRGAVVGIVLGSVALVVVLGGLAALALGVALRSGTSTASGSGGASTSGSSQSTDSQSTEGQSSNAPAPGATAAGEVLPEDAALLQQLPTDLTGCRSAALDAYAGQTPVAAVACTAKSLEGARINVLQFADETARDTAFSEYAGLGAASGTERCPAVDGSGPWTSPDGTGGGLASCYLVTDPESSDGSEFAVMAWSVTGQPFFLTAYDPAQTDLDALYAWQQQHASLYGAGPSSASA